MFVKNAWYIVARSPEITRSPVARMVCAEALVLYRKEDGTPVALRNQCPHRKYPLSEGRVVGDEIQCMYHGMKFDPDGACTFIPGQEEILKC